ncbi:hypothetical protein RHMOL_Rhmol02G0044200 [Rhododendron molle]|uniref:Uncharacterized protein n=1 Tax=Rhododendron molle TaxID=49168 RepID=A0ACC0PMU3_RHOML|nr:hypothetical protein RHMOL_Rhmol02G0044200 [Rhododendron molle]
MFEKKRKVNTLGGERGNNKTTGVRIAITMEDILKVKGMPLNDVAEHLEVSRSTLKRACREYGIKRWPPCKEHELINQMRPNKSPAIVDQEQIPQLNSDTVLPSNQPRKEHELISQTRPNESRAIVDQEQAPQLNSITVLPSNQVSARPNESPAVVDHEKIPQLNSDKVLPSTKVSATIDTKSVKLKARYEEVTIAFRLSRPFRKVELEQEVKKRLPLEAGTYNINYKDEDDDLILISCDEDLEECISSSSPLGSRCHELFLKPK